MPTYTHVRKKKWFTMLGTGPVGSFVLAIYNGQDSNGRPDPIGEGIIGKTYEVMILAKSDAILAPCPDFCNDGETIKLNASDRALVDRIRGGGSIKPGIQKNKGSAKLIGHKVPSSYQFVSTIPVCQPFSETEFLIYVSSVLNRTKLPYPARDYIYKEKGIYRLNDDLIGLIRELHESKPVSNNQRIAIHSYFALALYFRYITLSSSNGRVKLVENLRTTSLSHIAEALKLKPHDILRSFLIGIRKEMTPFKRVLVLVSFDYRQAADFGISLQEISWLDTKLVRTISDSQLKKYFSRYSQVLIFGHGDEDATYLGDTKLTDNKLIKAIGANNKTLSVLGIFSCQENLPEKPIKHHVDYFITNSHTCSEKTAKGFASAYCSKLAHAKDIIQAYDHASRAMLFRIVADLGFHLYQGGVRIR